VTQSEQLSHLPINGVDALVHIIEITCCVVNLDVPGIDFMTYD